MLRHWNYRVIRHAPPIEGGFESFSIHEVHYDEGGNPVAVSENPIRLVADTPQDLVADLKLMEEATRKPTLDYSSFTCHE